MSSLVAGTIRVFSPLPVISSHQRSSPSLSRRQKKPPILFPVTSEIRSPHRYSKQNNQRSRKSCSRSRSESRGRPATESFTRSEERRVGKGCGGRDESW